MKSVTLANGDKVELFYSFKTSKEMIALKTEVSSLEALSKKYGKEISMETMDQVDLDAYMDSLSKIICAVLVGSKYPCTVDEVDFLITTELIEEAMALLETQRKKEEQVQKKKVSPSSRKK